MKTNHIFAAILLGAMRVKASAFADESYDRTLESCLSFARKFAMTCSDITTSKPFSSIETANWVCNNGNYGTCPSHGTILSSGQCSFERKLCVSCFEENNVVRIRAQTNGMPNHCFGSPTTAAE